MKILTIGLILFMTVSGFAAEKPFDQATDAARLDIMLLQIQFRYEDSVEQSRQLQNYKGLLDIPILELNLAYQINNFRFSLGHSYQFEKTGNKSLEIRRSTDEFLLGSGYRVLHIESPDKNMALDLFAQVFAGVTQTQVETKLVGVSSKSKSNPDSVFAAGMSAVGRYKYAVVEGDVKYINSANMNPQYVPAFTVRAGGCIYF